MDSEDSKMGYEEDGKKSAKLYLAFELQKDKGTKLQTLTNFIENLFQYFDHNFLLRCPIYLIFNALQIKLQGLQFYL